MTQPISSPPLPALAGTVIHEDDRVLVRVREIASGQREVTLEGPPGIALPRRRSIVTAYPLDLIKAILAVKGPAYLVDEIARDVDPGYTHAYLRLDVPAYVSPGELQTARILDFGCGAGASTIVLHRMLPEAELVGVELDPELVDIAQRRKQLYGLDNVRFLSSPGPNQLPEGIGDFDVVMLSAVYEHLLPEDRGPLLDALFSGLREGGVLLIDQLPHRWFPLEGHTTFLPLLNYLPDRLAHRAAQLSPRIRKGTTWKELLQAGVRGGTTREILEKLERLGHSAEQIAPSGGGIHDEVELWYRGPSYEGYGPLKPAWNRIARTVQRRSGVALVPYLAIGIRKTGPRT